MSKFPYLPQQLDYENEEDYLPEEGYEGEEYLDDQDYGQQLPQMQPQQSPNFSMAQMQAMQQQMQPQQSQKPYNPYYDGIRSAIAEARESFNSSREQKDRALRKSILGFGKSIGGMERERGFKNNLLAAGRALGPAIEAYDDIESQSESMNEQLANKLIAEKQGMAARELAQNNIETDREMKMQELAQRYGLSERELAERMRHNQAIEGYQQQSLMSRLNEGSDSEEDKNRNIIVNLLDNAEKVIKQKGDSATYGVGSRLIDKFSPIGYRKNADQKAIDTIGNILQGDLFKKAFGYNSTAEFEHVPTLSSENTPEENMAVVEQLRSRFGIPSQNVRNIENEGMVEMVTPQGRKGRIPIEAAEAAKRKGYRRVN